jgi:hypothetical protein
VKKAKVQEENFTAEDTEFTEENGKANFEKRKSAADTNCRVKKSRSFVASSFALGGQALLRMTTGEVVPSLLGKSEWWTENGKLGREEVQE